MRPGLVLLLFLMASVAGCAGGGTDPDVQEVPQSQTADPAPAAPESPNLQERAQDGRVLAETFHGSGEVGAGVATWFAGHVAADGDQLPFKVRDGATAVVVELAWNDTVQDMDAMLLAANGCFDRHGFPDFLATCLADVVVADGSQGTWWNKGGAIGMPDSVSRIVVDGEALAAGGTGEWLAYAWTKDANVGLAFHVYATVLYDGRDPATFTAVPW